MNLIKQMETSLGFGSHKGVTEYDWIKLGHHGRGSAKGWMYELISNWRGFDVDRLDYLIRDPIYCSDYKEYEDKEDAAGRLR